MKQQKLWQIIKKNIGAILVFECVYRVIFCIVVWEAFSRGIAFVLKQSGYSYLTQSNFLPFLRLPLTWVVSVLILLLITFLLTIEMAVITTGFQAGANGESINLSKMCLIGLTRVKRLLKKGSISVMLQIGFLYLLSNSVNLLQLLTHVNPFYHQLTARMRNLKGGLWIAAALGFLLLWLIPRLFTAITVLFRHEKGKKAALRSKKLFRSNWRLILSMVIGINLSMIAALAVLYGISILVMVLLVHGLAPDALELSIAIILEDKIELALLFCSSILCPVSVIGILTGLYYLCQPELPPDLIVYRYKMPGAYTRAIAKAVYMALFIGIVLYFYQIIYNGAMLAENIFTDIHITSHRGSSFEAPENTLEALELATENMADAVEIDVQETLDGVVVLLHDNSLNRVAGIKKGVWQLTYEEVQALDAGSWFGADYEGVRIPSLESVFEQFKGRINFNIELKYNGHNPTLVEDVLALIEKYHMEEQVVLSTSRYEYITRVKELNPDISVGFIISAAYGNYLSDENIDFFSMQYDMVTPVIVEHAHRLGKEIHVWTVNTENVLKQMKRMGVDNIISDRPILAREVLYEAKTTETILGLLKQLK